ncbi:ENTPD6 [Cervus elaphus hippelaphus]|uniref:ENTPD6 n=1 Tax=Cervus elaphus hippelaphus TaxID=46360 RepID=A0A212CAX2_CEREH|nr:ENTPD6 [Cervus elaphus hippelaphus]
MRKIPNNGNLRMTKVAYPLGLFVCLFIYVAYIKWHWASATQAFLGIPEAATGGRRGQQAHSPPRPGTHGPEVSYGIMFDAGSTGTRVHVFQFSRQPGAEDGQELVSPCLSAGFRGEWEHAEVTYRIAGQETAGSLYQLCARRVSEILRNKVRKTEEVKDVEFYAFSYYYDLAANVGLIVCRTAETRPPPSPFLCLDLTYVSLLLQELGFPGDKVLKLTRKIDNVETSWALGATFHYIDSLRRHKSPAAYLPSCRPSLQKRRLCERRPLWEP